MFNKKKKRSSQTKLGQWRTTVSYSCASSSSGKRRRNVKFRAYYKDKRNFNTPPETEESQFYFVTILPDTAHKDNKTPNFCFVDAILSRAKTIKAEEKVIKESIFVLGDSERYARAWHLAETKTENQPKFEATLWIHHSMIFEMQDCETPKESKEILEKTLSLHEREQAENNEGDSQISFNEMIDYDEGANIEDIFHLEAFDRETNPFYSFEDDTFQFESLFD